ncbi:sigma-70 family RNA polymerase sigma factor [Arthrobacter sp. RIT-PI-e]|uniref:sigma-70 family RNA polymerase sigma factor n=1 Tax=Arthrobacter sp. RIT-PI-e TaxID=1681197 RepID=UPI000675C3A4|nr:sigma-70 family RNA polymerase sigma factor [Arthrobacter sp. RIT-PI-e]
MPFPITALVIPGPSPYEHPTTATTTTATTATTTTTEGAPDTPDLVALLLAVGHKDENAFRALYSACSPRVFGMARRIARNPEISAEITQEVFLQVWEQGARYTPSLGQPLTWLLVLTHRRAIDRIRSEVARDTRGQKWANEHISHPFDEVADTVLGRDDAHRVHASLALLSPVQREAICLAYFSHLTYAEVADHLGVPLSTVKTRIRDGLGKLRTMLNEQDTHP